MEELKLHVLPQHGFILSRLAWTIQTFEWLRTFGPPRNDQTKNTEDCRAATELHSMLKQPQSCTACSKSCKAANTLLSQLCAHVSSLHRTSVCHSNVKTSQFKHFTLLRFTVNKIPAYDIWKWLFLYPDIFGTGAVPSQHITGYRSPL